MIEFPIFLWKFVTRLISRSQKFRMQVCDKYSRSSSFSGEYGFTLDVNQVILFTSELNYANFLYPFIFMRFRPAKENWKSFNGSRATKQNPFLEKMDPKSSFFFFFFSFINGTRFSRRTVYTQFTKEMVKW